MPRVSVCMGVFNGSATILDALESARAQSFQDFEVLVIDDGSVDQSADIAEQFGARVIRQANTGLGAVRKRLVEEAKGDWIAFLDHDDEWVQNKLQTDIEAIDQSGAALVHSDCWFHYEDGRIVERNLDLSKAEKAWDHILPDNVVIASSAVFHRESMRQVGNFIPETVRCSDWYGWLILAPHHSFVHIPKKQVRYRVLSTSLANAGYRFQSAKRYLLKDVIRPRCNELFQELNQEDKSRYMSMIDKNIGVAASTMAKFLDSEGKREEARTLHREAMSLAGSVPRVWTRSLRSRLGLR